MENASNRLGANGMQTNTSEPAFVHLFL